MLKEAIEKIQELCAPHLFTSGNHDFIADAEGVYTEVKPDLEIVDNIQLSSLDAKEILGKGAGIRNSERARRGCSLIKSRPRCYSTGDGKTQR